MPELTVTNADEIEHSETLCAVIAEEIRKHGPIEFARFMELALYAPGLGYYSAGKHKFGIDGDFVTAPELGSVFAFCMAKAITPIIAQISNCQILELGPGTGALAADVLLALEKLDGLPEKYLLLERSADLRQRQIQTLQDRCAHLIHRVQWLDTPPAEKWRGILLANEVVDALPVQLFTLRDNAFFHNHVGLNAEAQLAWFEQQADANIAAMLASRLGDNYREFPQPYTSEYLPSLIPWLASVSENMQQGAALFVDYGYPRSVYYLAERRAGTLRCFYRHQLSDQPLQRVGLQDITASVDFTALVEAGHAAGFDLQCYSSQAQFLLNHGLPEFMQQTTLMDDLAKLSVVNQIKRLTLPAEMGESFQVMAFSKGIDGELFNPNMRDLSGRL